MLQKLVLSIFSILSTFSVIVLLNSSLVSAKYVTGHLITHEKWAFLDRFCFLSKDGSFEYQIEFEHDPENMGNISLLMYPDLHWHKAYRNEDADTCEKKVKVLKIEDFQIVPLIVGSVDAGCEPVNHPKSQEDNGNSTFRTTVLCKHFRKFLSARERWWFISIASCDSKKGLDIKYKFYMKNGNRGDYWYEHFSADEFYILPILTSFCFVYLFLLFSALIFAVELKCRQLLHTTYKLFLVSLALQTIGVMHLCIAYGNYASNGIGLPSVKLTGRVLEGASEFIFVLLLLLLAKGFTVTRGRLRPASSVRLTLFSCLYIFFYELLFVMEQYTFDPGLVTYTYESGAGHGILILRLVGYLMFIYGIFFTLKHYPEKASFYIPFFGIYSLWFISGPIVILISNYVIDKWVREKVAVSILHSIAFVGHVVFLGLTRPSAANKSFPYHVRTTQVGMMQNGHDNNQADNFEAHTYAPSAPPYDIFTVTGVVQRSQNGTHDGPNFDVFAANGSCIQPGATSVLPAMFPAPLPKYNDAFPHQKPGQVEEMLREPDEEESDDGREVVTDVVNREHEDNLGDEEDDVSSASYRPNSSINRSTLSPPLTINNNRERKYICPDEN